MGNDSAGLTDIIQAPPDKIIDALTDFESFPEWQAAVLECEVLDRDDEGRGSRVRMKVDAKVRKVEYIVRYHYDLPNGLGWEQESGDLKENTGEYTFVATRRRRAPRSPSTSSPRSASSCPGPMKKLIRDQSLKNSLRELKKRVES